MQGKGTSFQFALNITRSLAFPPPAGLRSPIHARGDESSAPEQESTVALLLCNATWREVGRWGRLGSGSEANFIANEDKDLRPGSAVSGAVSG